MSLESQRLRHIFWFGVRTKCIGFQYHDQKWFDFFRKKRQVGLGQFTETKCVFYEDAN